MVKPGEKTLRALSEKKWLLAAAAALIAAFCLQSPEGGITQTEARVARTLSQMEGAGRVEVTIHVQQSTASLGGTDETIIGAVAVCEGAGDIAVRLEVARALETLLGLEASQVVVLKMEAQK